MGGRRGAESTHTLSGNLEQEMKNELELVVPSPLRGLFQSCATFCVPGCCGLDAFDVDAYVIFRWLRKNRRHAGSKLLQQLDILIAQVEAHFGPVDSPNLDFGNQWRNSADCVAYLQTWREQLVRALSLKPDALKSPKMRLAKAQLLGEREYRFTVRRITGDALLFLENGERRAAVKILRVIARLDENDPTIADEVKYARKTLAEHTHNQVSVKG